jgi:mannose-1-phosphate guanylyltransferase
VPKQFCSLDGGPTLLEDALARAEGLIAAERVCTIVAQQHREWWSQILRRAPEKNIVVQPRNRGTGIGVLYSLLHILARDPQARVLLLPADHYVRDESILRQSLREALHCVEQDGAPVLLGLEPEDVDVELGYILPGKGDKSGARTVRQFVEKPEEELASRIINEGGLWNAFIIAASAQRLLDLFTRRFAAVVMEMRVILSRCQQAGLPESAGWSTIVDMYGRLPEIDFSRDLLEGREATLRVVRVPRCGWSDLGTPRRLGETLSRLGKPRVVPHHRTNLDESQPINLAVRHAHFEQARAASQA